MAGTKAKQPSTRKRIEGGASKGTRDRIGGDVPCFRWVAVTESAPRCANQRLDKADPDALPCRLWLPCRDVRRGHRKKASPSA